MMGKQYIIIDDMGRVRQKGEIKDSTMEFWNLGKGIYIFWIPWMPKGTSKKVIVK
jgi:hypothetical protein